ncbi:LOW QUALITY PROTEIN: hypothetical protein PHMEG_00027373 [Phytophthora megakarya]|uniref:Uncharacterized protein n=1 Tax=Phytophthora megakarya TaxID=4795 RepID=A0A225V5X8_9STRA|nr:LOW QUALITY PROTEIN: hypothetical protein PHMEG_00027373 [Phytophthora megakarya]
MVRAYRLTSCRSRLNYRLSRWTRHPSWVRLQGECSKGVLPKYGRLFSDADLDKMETCEPDQKESTHGGTTIKSEEEEYDKELKDRLYPLDEVELLRRRVKNAETQKEPALE